MMERESTPRRKIDFELDRLEQMIADLKIEHEQYFLDILPRRPEQKLKETQRLIRQLHGEPFKQTATKFRFSQLVQRLQTLNNYWERILKQREAGTYSRDVYKANLRSGTNHSAVRNGGRPQKDKSMEQLYETYKQALKLTGSKDKNVDFNAFKRNLAKNAKQISKKTGVKDLQYKISVEDGKVSVKATPKK